MPAHLIIERWGVKLWVAVLAALQFAQCLFVALKSSLTNPVAGLSVIMLYPLANCVEVAKLELRFCIALISGLAVPRGSLSVAERDALTHVVEVG